MERPAASSTPGEDARPLRRDAARNRRLILEAAHELFAERGLDVTLDDVARHAGVGVGTVYRRFSGKEELIDALFEEQLDRLVAKAERALGEESPWDAFAGFLVGCTEDLVRDHGLREVILSGAYACARVVQVRERLTPLAEALIRRAQEAGELRDDFRDTDIPLIEEMLGSVYRFAQSTRPEVWRRYLVFVLDGLRPRPGLTPLEEHALTPVELGRITGVHIPEEWE